VVRWVRDLFAFPETATGLFVTGTSMANFIALLVARTRTLGKRVRRRGVGASGRPLVAYASAAAHRCIVQAMNLSGLGIDSLRSIPINHRHQIDLAALATAIAADRRAGGVPFLLVRTARPVPILALPPPPPPPPLPHPRR